MTSIDDTLSEIRWLRNEIWRHRRSLKKDLPERKAVEKRLLEQLSAFERLLSTAFPLTLSPKVYSAKSITIGRSDSPEARIENAAMASSGSFGKSTGG
ncbi:hypothetical protein [Bradyrhizobium sp. Ghvi]|uniref:hypothetical protein n=1 Tax=Bradyrhizobium sp. Ghvi TaxID=1855319 RepID=UPI000A93489D|nr:hypothetical protein [Bradyrhizobium sp. Ghvi]